LHSIDLNTVQDEIMFEDSIYETRSNTPELSTVYPSPSCGDGGDRFSLFGGRPLYREGQTWSQGLKNPNTMLNPFTFKWHEREYTERVSLGNSRGLCETVTRIFNHTKLSSLDEQAAQERTKRLQEDEELPLNHSIGEGEWKVKSIDDPTNHDRMAMHLVHECRQELVGIHEHCIANVDRAEKWVSAELRQHKDLRSKHRASIKVKFMLFIFHQQDYDVDGAVYGASRAHSDMMYSKDYNHGRRGWLGFFRKNGRRPAPARA